MRFLRSDYGKQNNRPGYYRFKMDYVMYPNYYKERIRNRKTVILTKNYACEHPVLMSTVAGNAQVYGGRMIKKLVKHIPMSVYVDDLLRCHDTALTIRALGLKEIK